MRYGLGPKLNFTAKLLIGERVRCMRGGYVLNVFRAAWFCFMERRLTNNGKGAHPHVDSCNNLSIYVLLFSVVRDVNTKFNPATYCCRSGTRLFIDISRTTADEVQ